MSQNKKVLVILGDGKLLGQQRANIQVFHMLKSAEIKPIFILGLKNQTIEIVNHLSTLNFNYLRIPFADLFNMGMGFTAAIMNFIILIKSNVHLAKQILKIKPDYIHITNEINYRNLFPVVFLSFKPVIYRVGDAPRQHHWVFRFIWRYLIIPLTYKFICVSHYVKNILIQAGAKEYKIKVIYSFPPVRTNSNFLKLPTTITESFNIIFIGQIAKHKGIDLLIDACIDLFKKYSSIKLFVAGYLMENDSFQTQLKDRISKFNLNERIIFLGNVEDISTLLNIAHLHVCPSVWEEPLSNTIIEAKSCSVPSIIFKSGGLPEIINHKIDGYICEEKTTLELIKAIEYFYHRKNELKNYKSAAQQSLIRLGITKNNFINQWLETFS